jgi:hypothetical protein
MRPAEIDRELRIDEALQRQEEEEEEALHDLMAQASLALRLNKALIKP